MTRSTLIAVLTALMTATFFAAVPARAQAVFHAQVGWEGDDSPQRVEFSTGSANSRPFRRESAYFEGTKPYRTLYARQGFVVRWPSVTLTLRGRAQVPKEVPEAFYFRLSKPDPAMVCNDDNVRALFSRSRRVDIDTRVSTMMQIALVLGRNDSGCSRTHRKNLANQLFNLNCNLAKETDFFDLSPDVLRIFRDAFGDSAAVRTAIKSCEDEVLGKAITAANEASLRAKAEGRSADFFALNTALDELAQDSEFAGGLAAARLTRNHFQHRELEVLFGQYEARPREIGQLASVGEEETESAQVALVAAKRLDQLSRQNDYDQAFRDAFGSLRQGRRLARGAPITAQRVIDQLEDRELELSAPVSETILTDPSGTMQSEPSAILVDPGASSGLDGGEGLTTRQLENLREMQGTGGRGTISSPQGNQ